MEKIDFVNATHPAINDTNLNKMQDNIETAINAQVSGDTLPIAAIIPWSTTIAPNQNWLVCNGQAVSRTTYSQLFNIIGTQYGEGDGSTTFNVPDLRGRHPMGYNLEDTDFNRIGKTGGEKTHTLTKNELPSNIIDTANSGSNTDGYIARAGYTKSGSYDFGGGSQPFNVLDPYLTTNYIIKAFQTAGVIAEVVNVRNNSQTKVYSTSYINNIVDYSTTEKVCGAWTDGKPRYCITVPCGNLYNNARKVISTSVPTTASVKKISGIAIRGGDSKPIENATTLVLFRADTQELFVDTDSDQSAWDAYVYLEYTKSTD